MTSSMHDVKLQHNMTALATCVAVNEAGRRTIVPSQPILVDWTPPDISDVTASVRQTASSSHDVGAVWSVSDETELTGCYWWIGSSAGSDDVMQKSPTDTMTSSTASVTLTSETFDVYVTISCFNRVSLRSEVTPLAQRFLASPPEALEAVVESSEQSVAWQQARNSTQADADALAFTFAGFGNEDSVSGYEYMYSTGGRESEWVSVGQQVREFYLLPSTACARADAWS